MVNQLTTNNYKVEIDTFNKEKWSRITENFKDASIYQTWQYGEVRWGKRPRKNRLLPF